MAPPRFGHTLVIGLVSGTVLVTPPRSSTFKLGVRDRDVPIASLIDTTHGRVDLRVASTPGSGSSGVQDTVFYAGRFRVRQAPGAYTEIQLAGGTMASCHASQGTTTAAGATTTSSGQSSGVPHQLIRYLWGTGAGDFTTVGNDAAATVRGTYWRTSDYCDGTAIKVRKGVVDVRNLHTNKVTVVRAGHSVFVPAA